MAESKYRVIVGGRKSGKLEAERIWKAANMKPMTPWRYFWQVTWPFFWRHQFPSYIKMKRWWHRVGKHQTFVQIWDAETDAVNPQHYKNHPSGVECITITEWFSFNLGNAVKYIWRAGEKGREQEDLEKALWYLKREIERIQT